MLWSLRSDGHIFCAWEPRLWKLWDGEMFRDIGHGIVYYQRLPNQSTLTLKLR